MLSVGRGLFLSGREAWAGCAAGFGGGVWAVLVGVCAGVFGLVGVGGGSARGACGLGVGWRVWFPVGAASGVRRGAVVEFRGGCHAWFRVGSRHLAMGGGCFGGVFGVWNLFLGQCFDVEASWKS